MIQLAAAAPEGTRKQARFNLARFYLSREMAAEAKAVLDVALATPGGTEDLTGAVLYLAGDGAKFTTGAVLVIDGGQTQGGAY